MRWYSVVGLAAGAVAAAAGALLGLHTQAHAVATASAPVPKASVCQDADGDGYGLGCALGQDCNDQDGLVHPGQREACNFRDDDCNALVDDGGGCDAPAIMPGPVSVPSGAFLMGSVDGPADERPLHRVALGSYRIDRQEVTNARYRQCVRAGSCTPPRLGVSRHRPHYFEDASFDDYPVIFVDWHQAQSFCRFAGGRLPTEAEWEKAARGAEPSRRTYPWGEDAPDCRRANMGGPGSCVGDTDRVGRRAAGASPYGALDMAGNVWEWVGDWYDAGYYTASPTQDPTGPAHGQLKVMRGGCWLSGADSLRVSCRKAELATSWAYNVGFRCVYPEGR
jgi:formylglycine-generating enzyme required for sulfatase activity